MLTPPTLPAERVITPVDPETLNKVLESLRQLVSGNGVRPEDVVLDHSKAEIFTFGARTYIRLVAHHTMRMVAGKHAGGEVLGSLDSLHRTIQGRVAAIRTDQSLRGIALKYLDTRADKGFAVRDERFFITELAKDFVAHDTCQTCTGTGSNVCGSCGGKRTQNCTMCHGRRSELCPTCRGTKQVMVNGKGEPCRMCASRGQIACRMCKGSGSMPCGGCKGAGNVQCRTCNGTRTMSHIASTQIEAHIHFDYDRGGMTAASVKMMDGQGADFAKNAVRFEILAQPTVPLDEPADIITRDYTATIAAGAVVFKIKGKKLTVDMAGFNGMIVNAPPFLDILTRSGQTALKSAAEGKGNVAALVLKASKYRTLREIIQVAAKTGVKPKGLQILTQRYTVGIDPKRIKILLQYSDQALRSITKKPIIIGVFCGLLLSAVIGFFAAYFIKAYGIAGYALITCIAAMLMLCGAKFASFLALRKLNSILATKKRS